MYTSHVCGNSVRIGTCFTYGSRPDVWRERAQPQATVQLDIAFERPGESDNMRENEVRYNREVVTLPTGKCRQVKLQSFVSPR